MILSGNNILSLSEQTGISYSIDLSLNNSTGTCNLGFSGQSKFNFKFKDGKVFDNEDLLIYSYSPNEQVNISGNINTDGYDYYINNYYYANKNKNFIKFNSFYLNASNTNADIDLIINGDKPNYELSFNDIFYIHQNITGKIKNNSNLKFKIYSGEVTYPITFSIDSIPSFSTEITNVYQNIIIKPDLENSKNLFLNKSGEFLLSLYTNFGKITGSFLITGEYVKSGIIKHFNFDKNYSTSLIKTGKTTFNQYILNIDFGLEDETGYFPFNKDIEIEFIYKSGYTGTLYKDIEISTGINKTLTGFISGSGYLSSLVTATGSGINLLNDQIVTGLVTNNISGFSYVNGFLINKVNILGSGIKKDIYIDQVVKITGNDAQTIDQFGYSASLNSEGNVALVGAYLEDPNEITSAGSAYIFTGSGNSWAQAAKITGNDAQAGDRFGWSVSLNSEGNVALIGAYAKDLNGVNQAGSAYIFTGSGNSWAQAAKITGNDAQVFDQFGNSVSLNSEGNVALIGAYAKDPNGVSEAGSAYIFTGSGNSWAQAAKITGNDAQVFDYFGYSVALNGQGNIALIGSYFEDPNGVSNAGSAYIFTGSGNSWTQAAKITGNDAQIIDQFGYSVSLNSEGNIALVGASFEDPNGIGSAGSAYIFTGSGNSWAQAAKITGNDAQAGDQFGRSVSLNSEGNVALVGAYLQAPNGLNQAGSAYIFTRSGNSWAQAAKITGNDAQTVDQFGISVSLNSEGNVALVGAYLEDPNGVSNAGSAYIINTYNEKLLYTGVTGEISGFAEEGVLPYGDNIINIIDNTSYTGYLESVIATGIVSLTQDFNLTGLTTINYQKTFTGTFNLITGYTDTDVNGNLTPTGFLSFRNFNNFNNKYYSNHNLTPEKDIVTFIIEKRKFYDDYILSGDLNISGKRLDYNLTTGIKIPIKFGDLQWP